VKNGRRANIIYHNDPLRISKIQARAARDPGTRKKGKVSDR